MNFLEAKNLQILTFSMVQINIFVAIEIQLSLKNFIKPELLIFQSIPINQLKISKNFRLKLVLSAWSPNIWNTCFFTLVNSQSRDLLQLLWWAILFYASVA